MPNLGLSVNDVVNVSVLLSPTGAALRNFGSLMILGDSATIDTQERYRLYSGLAGVAADFGTSAPEYLAAQIFFAQSPTPAQLYIGRWARTASSGRLNGGVLSAAQQALSNFTGIANGTMSVTIDGVVKALTGINLTGVSTLNGVAAAVQTALGGSITCVWDANNSVFRITSGTTGASSTVTFASTQGTGTDISALLLLQTGQGGYLAQGIIAETALVCATLQAGLTNNWYGLMFAASTQPVTADYLAVAGLIEGLSPSHIFGITTADANALNAANSTDVASQLQALKYNRSFVQYASGSPYACAAIFGIAFTVNFSGANTTLTLKFKTEVGIVAETLTETQAAALVGKNCNVFVNFNNSTAIVQNGTMASGQFFDTVHGTDWLQNFIQTTVYNLLYTSTTKIPQTDQGVSVLLAGVAQCCEQAVVNGLIAPGVWTGPAVGVITTGQTLSKGFYIYAPPVSSQSAAARAARQSPVIQAAIKLAGAIHSVNVLVNVNS